MASFDDTRELERTFLKLLMKTKMMARLNIFKVRREWFTGKERLFIWECIKSTFDNSKSILTRRLFLYELQGRIDDEKERDYYASEWEMVEDTEVFEDADGLISRLKEAVIGRRIMDAAEEMAMKLESANIQEALESLKRSAISINNDGGDDHEIVEITDYQHRLKVLRDKQEHPEKYLGIKTGFPSFDRCTGGLFKEELLLVAGVTGLGKSTFVKQLQYGIITNNIDKNVLHIANEESQDQVEMKFDSLLTEVPYLDYKLARTSEDDIEKWIETMEKTLKNPGVGRIFVKEVPQFTDVTLVEQAYNELKEKGIDIHVIIIDHLPHIKPIGQVWGENDERAKAAADCKQLAKNCKCSVVIPTQAATEVEEKQSKGKRAGRLDVYGSKGQIHVANSFLMITKRGTFEEVGKPDYLWDVHWLCDMKKNRDGPGFYFEARHYVEIGKVEEILGDNAFDNWDDEPEPSPSPEPEIYNEDDGEAEDVSDSGVKIDENVPEKSEKKSSFLDRLPKIGV